MRIQKFFIVAAVLVAALAGCGATNTHSTSSAAGNAAAPRGHLLIIGGGLDDDNKPVYERFLELASRGSEPPVIVIATAASGDEPANAKGKTQSIRAYRPDAVIEVIGRETSTEESVAIIDRAHAMFFTGGDQKRITTRYLTPDGRDTPEAAAMRALLRRGGVIAGTSAGDAMMSDPMFFTGRSAEALGIRSTRTQRGPDDDADDKRPQPPLGPQIGKGMGFLEWAVTDSHFFERHRFGRLVAALEQSGKGLGIGVGEDAGVEVDLATGEMIGVSVADSLLVDARGVRREGLTRRGVRAKVITQGTRVSLPALLARSPVEPAHGPPESVEEIPVVEPGQNRQLASWRFFTRAQQGGATQFLKLDGYDQRGWSAGGGWSVVEIVPQPAPSVPQKPGATEK